MSTPTINTVVKMIESLPEGEQDRVLDHLREYIVDLQDESQWNTQFRESQERLVLAATKARQQAANGESKPLKISDL